MIRFPLTFQSDRLKSHLLNLAPFLALAARGGARHAHKEGPPLTRNSGACVPPKDACVTGSTCEYLGSSLAPGAAAAVTVSERPVMETVAAAVVAERKPDNGEALATLR